MWLMRYKLCKNFFEKKINNLIFNIKAMNKTVVFKYVTSVLCSILMSSCAYRLSNKVDHLPGDIQYIYIPLFENIASEPNVEMLFTNALKSEALRFSKVNVVSSKNLAQATLSGVIQKIIISTDDSILEAKDADYLPYGTNLPTQIKVNVTVSIKLVDNKTDKIIWQSEFVQSKNYTPPQITLPGLNSANNNYNLSERRLTINLIAKEMMQLALDRLVDNF